MRVLVWEQKFNLLEKSMGKTQGAIENLGKLLQIPTPVRIESFDNSNIMGTSPVSAMVVFVNGKPSKRTIASTRSRPLSDQMTMPACEKSFADATAGLCGMAWRHQTRSLSMGVRARLISLNKSSKKSWSWTFLSQACKEWQAPDPWIALRWSPSSHRTLSDFTGIFPPATDPRWSPPFRYHLPPPATVQEFPSPLSWMASKVWGPKRKQLLMKHFQVTDQDQGSYCGWDRHGRYPTSSREQCKKNEWRIRFRG